VKVKSSNIWPLWPLLMICDPANSRITAEVVGTRPARDVIGAGPVVPSFPLQAVRRTAVATASIPARERHGALAERVGELAETLVTSRWKNVSRSAFDG
jgi:hypothetical protein